MFQKVIATLALSVSLILLSIPGTHAQAQESFFYYLLPPQTAITVNDQKIRNETLTGKMVFRRNHPEEIVVDAQTAGIRVVSNNYHSQIKPETKMTFSNIMRVEAGSVHISSRSDVIGPSQIELGGLLINFQSASFVVFISGDQSEKIIKVLDGEVNVKNPQSNQEVLLKTKQATSTEKDGKLLFPYPFAYTNGNYWWAGNAFDYEFIVLPIAQAGDDQRVLGNIPVVLDGSKSQYKTGDIFEWTLIKAPLGENGQEITELAFDSTNIVKPLFTPVVEGEYYLSLQITDEHGERSNLDKVIVYVGREYLKPISIFPDVPTDYPHNMAITYLYKKNVMIGTEDPETGKKMFYPDRTLNRVEILKTVFGNKGQIAPTTEELLDLSEEIFADVQPEHWFAPYVFLAKKQGIIKGNDGFYRPADDVLLVEALKIIVTSNQISLDAYEITGQKPYPDTEKDTWYNPYLFFVKKYNLVDADQHGNINPAQPLTRAKFAEIIYRMESINLLEKRGFLLGRLKETTTKKGIPNAEIYIYQTQDPTSTSSEGADNFVMKGDLYYKTTTRSDGSFNVSLPVKTKYYIEAISGDNISHNKIVTEVKEDQISEIELKIEF